MIRFWLDDGAQSYNTDIYDISEHNDSSTNPGTQQGRNIELARQFDSDSEVNEDNSVNQHNNAAAEMRSQDEICER